MTEAVSAETLPLNVTRFVLLMPVDLRSGIALGTSAAAKVVVFVGGGVGVGVGVGAVPDVVTVRDQEFNVPVS